MCIRDRYTVFASSGGDSEVLDKICTALTLPDRPVSPTQFHHSVHNTPAGYWSIATGCTQPSLSLSAYDSSFSAGLLEAAALAWAEAVRVLSLIHIYSRARHGADRIGVFVGTSTSGIGATEHAYRQRDPVTGSSVSYTHLDVYKRQG